MNCKKIETTAEEVLAFLKDAGIEFEDDIASTSFQIRLQDGSIVKAPRDWNLFEEYPQFTITGNYLYEFSKSNLEEQAYVLINSNLTFENYLNPSQYVLAA